jgi:hypothetical protein
MNKTLVIMGISAMIIGIGFGAFGLVDQTVNNAFAMCAVIWTFGAIATVLGLSLFEEEGIHV